MATITPEKTDDITPGGIYLTQARDKYYGTVRGVGNDVKLFKRGDRIAFKQQNADKIKDGDEDIYLISEDEAFGIDIGGKFPKMLGDHILLKQVESCRTKGGLFVSEFKNVDIVVDIGSSEQAVVFSVSDYITENSNIRVGDWVITQSPLRVGFEITIDGEKYNVMRKHDIILKQEIIDE